MAPNHVRGVRRQRFSCRHRGGRPDRHAGRRRPGNLEDENRSPAFVGRLAWSPGPKFEVGVSTHRGAYNEFRRGGLAVDRRRDVTIAVVDLDAEFRGFRVSGEAARVDVELPPALSVIRASRQEGFFLEFTRDLRRGVLPTMPGSVLSGKIRLEAADFDAAHAGDSERRLGVGLNFRPTRDTVLKLDHVAVGASDRLDNPVATAAVLFSIATCF